MIRAPCAGLAGAQLEELGLSCAKIDARGLRCLACAVDGGELPALRRLYVGGAAGMGEADARARLEAACRANGTALG